jgi:hypothetical protein
MRAAALGQQMDEMDVLTCYAQGWPEPYIHTVYDRMYRVGQNRLGIYTVYAHLMYGDFPAKNAVYAPNIRAYIWFWPTLRMFGNFPVKRTVCTPYRYTYNVWFWPTLVMLHY